MWAREGKGWIRKADGIEYRVWPEPSGTFGMRADTSESYMVRGGQPSERAAKAAVREFGRILVDFESTGYLPQPDGIGTAVGCEHGGRAAVVDSGKQRVVWFAECKCAQLAERVACVTGWGSA